MSNTTPAVAPAGAAAAAVDPPARPAPITVSVPRLKDMDAAQLVSWLRNHATQPRLHALAERISDTTMTGQDLTQCEFDTASLSGIFSPPPTTLEANALRRAVTDASAAKGKQKQSTLPNTTAPPVVKKAKWNDMTKASKDKQSDGEFIDGVERLYRTDKLIVAIAVPENPNPGQQLRQPRMPRP